MSKVTQINHPLILHKLAFIRKKIKNRKTNYSTTGKLNINAI